MGNTEKKIDAYFTKMSKYVSAKIGHFVAFMFFLFALGAFAMIMVLQKYPHQALLVIAVPAVAGLLAYYNRTVAVVLFALIFLAILFL